SQKQGIETAAYISNEQKVGSRFSIGYGLRVSGFTRVGKGTEYQFDVKGELADSSMYGEGEFYSPYWYVEPRLNTSLILNENASIKAGYNRLSQYIHLLQNATSGTPIDLWVPSSPNVKPQLADQVSLGFFRNFNNHIYQFSAETYYKWMYNQIDYKTGAEIILNEMVEGELLYGTGKAYGLELMLEKAEGKLTGWISYTLSRSLKQIDGINNNYWYPARQDRIHDLAIVGIYRLNPKWTISANWIYYTGNAVTFPAGKYYFDGKTVNLYTERNGYRMPDYHRLDIGATWLLAEKKNYRSELNFSVYNAYGHKNAYNYIFTEDSDNPGKTKTVMVYLFSVLPSVTWNFKF
ncbi:MAG TPA: TonB-dependent receptor, partial [Prolixibacteraceae bacterium]|nr:TonB-dependent receptor [Prolixibacteraceae bacterium]